MKWKLNPSTMMMEPERKGGFRVSGRIGGVMVEDFDRNIRFLINYGTDRVTHCVGCTERDLHIFDTQTARRIASEIGRVARAHNASTRYSDYRYICRGMRGVDEAVSDRKMGDAYRLSLLINRLYTASAPFTRHKYRDSAWQNVYAHVEALGKVEGVEDVELGAGEYFNYFHGSSVDDTSPAYRKYDIRIKTRYGVVSGRLICHSAGTKDDPFDAYDMTCTFYKENGYED